MGEMPMISLSDGCAADVPTMPVCTLIVDDEDLSRERVRSLLARDERVEVVGECANGVEALHVIEKEAPDLVFLDIEMPEQSGFEMLEAIAPERYPQIVFVTAYDEYWQRAFEVHALDYLRKPFTDERFYDALAHACRRVEERLGHVRTRQSVLAMLAQLRQESSDGQDRVVVHGKERGVFHIVHTRDIESIEVKEGDVFIHAGRETHRSRQTLAEIEASLDAVRFLRVHRSRIVNRSRIQRVEWLLKGEYVIILTSGRRVATGRSYRRVIEAFLKGR